MNDAVIIAALTVAASIVIQVIGWRVNFRHMKAETAADEGSAAKSLAESSVALLEPYKKEVRELRILVEQQVRESAAQAKLIERQAEEIVRLQAHAQSQDARITELKAAYDKVVQENLLLRAENDGLKKSKVTTGGRLP